jgi:hypothetical protein
MGRHPVNVYMIYNPEEDLYLSVRGLWSWASQEFSIIFKDLEEVENTIIAAFLHGWVLEIHTFKMERIT